MREFFFGWRRMAGYVALVMALGLVALWLRGFVFTDEIQFKVFDRCCMLSTGHGYACFGCCKWSDFGFEWNTYWFTFPITQENENYALMSEIMTGHWKVDYWLPVVACTLLSSYLILWTPRPNPKREPNA